MNLQDEPPPPWMYSAAPCVQCGYSLAGLPDDGVCPECGTPIAFSRRGELLCFCSPEYLTRLHSGAVAVEVALALKLVLGVLGWVVVWAAGITTGGLMTPLVQVMQTIVGLALSWLTVWGWWNLTSPDPGRMGEPPATSVTTLRIALVIQLVLQLGSMVLQWMGALPFGNAIGSGMRGLVANSPTVLVVWSVISAAVAVGVWLTAYFASMLVVQALARRIPDVPFERSARRVMWMPLYTAAVVAASLVLGMCAGIFIGPLVILFFGGVALTFLVWFIMYWVVIDGLRSRLKLIRDAVSAEYSQAANDRRTAGMGMS